MSTWSRALQTSLYHAVAGLFYAAPRQLYDLRVTGARRFRHRPSTLIVINHKRDLDSVIIPPTLLYNGHPRTRPIWFAGREDMFLRGFLASYDVVPVALRRLLYEIDLTPVLGALRVLPVRRFPERTMDEALREATAVLGDRPLEEVLSAEEAARWQTADPRPRRLSDLLHWRFHGARHRPATLRAFAPPARDRLRQRQEVVVAGQIRALAGVLNRGDVLYLAPEGVISPNGRLQPFRSGLRQILTAAEVPVRLQAACIVYDFIRPGRLTVHLTIGEEMEPLSGGPAAAEALARGAIAALHVMTPSQVVSQVAWEAIAGGKEATAAGWLRAAVRERAADLRGRGLAVDPALLGADAATRIDDWTRYLVRKGWAILKGGELRVAVPRLLAAPVTHWENPIRYGVNEVQSVLSALAPAPPASVGAGSP